MGRFRLSIAMSSAGADKLTFLLQHDPQTDTAHLEYSDITDFGSLMGDLRALSNLTELYIHGNRLTTLVPDMSQLRRLEKIDIRGNPFSDIPDVAASLGTLSNLKHLLISVRSEQDEDALFSFLPKVQTINSVSCNRGGTVDPDPAASVGQDTMAISEQEFDAVVDLYESVTSLAPRADSTELFDRHADVVMGELDSAVMRCGDDAYARTTVACKHRADLYSVCWDAIAEQLAGQPLAAPVAELRRVHYEIVGKLVQNCEDQTSSYKDKIHHLTSDIELAANETSDMLMGAEEMEKQFLDRMNVLSAEWERERSALQNEIASLRSGGASSGSGMITVRAVSPTKEPQMTQSLANLPRPKPGARELSNKQLLTFIEELYESKVKFDTKCREARLPRETMEQHLYTYLNQKYGLKSLIIEWASAVMAAVKKFSDEDNDVAVFGRILRNEIDEEFRIVQKQLKDTVAELLRVYLKGKHPLKSEDEVSKLLNKRIKSFVFEEEWTDIIKYMYNHEDSVSLIIKCKDYIEASQHSQQQQPAQRRGRRDTREEAQRESGKMMFDDFLKILLDFQLKGHEKFLLKFMKLFRQFDKDKNGVINEEEFRQLIIATDPNKTDKEIQDLLNLVDPHNNQQISFSECVNFLSSDLVHLSS